MLLERRPGPLFRTRLRCTMFYLIISRPLVINYILSDGDGKLLCMRFYSKLEQNYRSITIRYFKNTVRSILTQPFSILTKKYKYSILAGLQTAINEDIFNYSEI